MTACRYVSRTEPRVLPGRHREDCEATYTDAECGGCQPCREAHCRVCGVAHADGSCPECLGAARDDLHQIARMCDALPEEVEHRGIHGEAMTLLGPAADPEAWGHHQASVMVGRLRPDEIEGGGELHPLTTLGTWRMVWEDHLEHESDEVLTVATATDYLDRNLHYMAGQPLVPFEDFARDLRRCRAHLEAVLHDGEQVERTRVPCTADHCTTRPRLVVAHGKVEAEDHYRCPSCGGKYDAGEYARAKLRMLVSAGAERHVRMQDARDAVARPARTWRKWIRYWHVRSYRDPITGQVWVWWPDVRAAELATQRRTPIAG